MTTLDAEAVTDHANNTWEGIVPVLHDYIAIPNVSLDFDPEWREHGFMAEAVDLIAGWCRDRPIPGMTLDVMELPGRTPMIVIEIPPAGGLGPWTPVLEGDRLYGRGGADDGYAAFASLTAIEAVHAAGGVHTRCVVLIEASEESGSPDLPAYIDALADTIGTPSLVVCLDSGCIDYDRMWVTTSLRGMVMGKLTVDIVTEGLHSGDASGMIPSTFRIARQLLERIEDSSSGELLLPELQVEVPAGRLAEAQSTAEEIGAIATHYPFVDGAGPTTDDPAGQLLARTWRGTLSVVGADGLPPAARAGNVLRPSTTLKLSFRLPPTADPDVALAAIIAALESDPPYGARVRFHETDAAPGWNAPATAPWLEVGLDAASNASFGQPARSFGEGGSIPFMGMLGEKFPEVQFVITGVFGPDANAHGPNEYLHVPTARKVTMAVAHLLNAHATR